MAQESLDSSSRRFRLSLTVFVTVAAVLIGLAGWSMTAFSAGETYTVNSTLDATDASPGDNKCQTSSSTGRVCTLRAAVQEANARSGSQNIKLGSATYAVKIAPINANLAESGDFDITGPINFTGNGESATVIDGGVPLAGAAPDMVGLDRLFEIHPNAGNVSFKALTVREGYSPEGGGAIENWSTGTVKLEDVTVRGSHAEKYGGGLNNVGRGRVDIIDSTFTGNAAGNGGAAINNAVNGTINILSGTQITGNPGTFEPGSGAIYNSGDLDTIGTIKVADSTVSNNVATANGAGINNDGDGNIILERATFSKNVTDGSGGGVYTTSGNLTVTNSTFLENSSANGGGIYAGGANTKAGLPSDIKFTGSTFRLNIASGAGGGADLGGDAKVTVTDSVFDQNRTESCELGVCEAGGEAGGLAVHGRASATVLRGSFTKNVGSDYAGGLAIISEKSSVIDGTLFDGNHAGDGGGGGLFTDGGGGTVIKNVKVLNNTSTGDGGGAAIHSFGAVEFTNSEIRNNRVTGEESNGGGIENAGQRGIFSLLQVTGNTATANGGGIHNSSSNQFTLLSSHVEGNVAENGGGFTNASDSTLTIRDSLFMANTARNGPRDDHGMGGGIFSISDGGSLIENTTISSNSATVAGGGLFHDADGELRLHNVTVWRNSAPKGGGLGLMESDVVPTVPPTPHVGFILKNTIVAGSLQGGGCDGALTSEGGNLEEGILCYLQGPRDKSRARMNLDAIADNGGPTLTHALKADSFAVDRGVGPCILTDQRGVSRPKNVTCDSGAFEFEGAPLPPDEEPPTSEYLTGPIQDTEETSLFTFTGRDNASSLEALTFECRLLEIDPTEPPEPLPPGVTPDPLDEEAWKGCESPWQIKAVEEGHFSFEVKATDQQGNVGEPDVHLFSMGDFSPPETLILEKPAQTTYSRAATFTFSAIDDASNPQFMEYECRLDTIDPEAWLECINPTMFSNLTTGEHTIYVRATDAADNIDPTPARYTWTIAPPVNCDQANINLVAVADGWADEGSAAENFMFYTDLTVRSGVAENARSFYRFALPTQTANCRLESATLRLYQDGGTAGRTLQAVPITSAWSESTLTWGSQPTAGGTAAEALALGGDGYLEWDVTAQVTNGAAGNGFMIKDAAENDALGADNSFVSREMAQDPPPITLPFLVLRYEAASDTPPAAQEPPVEATVTCGQVITRSTKVMNDLTDCLGEGLVIGGSNIILDLNGKTIDGPDYLLLMPGEEEGLFSGIRVSGHDNVTIKNGTVQQFGAGIQLSAGTTRSVVDDVTLLRNAIAGVDLYDADDGRNGNTIKNSTISENQLGVQFASGSENSAVLDSTIAGNLGEAVYIVESSGIRVERNEISGIPPDPALDSDGGFLVEGSSRNIIKENRIHDTGDAGLVFVDGSNSNLIEGNVLFRNGDAGISIQDSSRNQVIGNLAHLESDGGIVLNHADNTVVKNNDVRYNPNGIDAGDSSNLLIEGNDASDTQAEGISVGNGLNIQILNNTAHRTGGSGIAMEVANFDANGVPVGVATISGNKANQNLQDGISVDAGGHLITNNSAHNNAVWGIAAEGNVDGNLNNATGNGIEEQCLGVVCGAEGAVPLTPIDETAPDTEITGAPENPARTTTAIFEFEGIDPDNGTPPNVLPGTPSTAMIYECRIDPMPDPPFTPEPTDEPDPTEVVGPNETVTPEPTEVPDSTDPPVTEGWAECTSPAVYQGLTPGSHHFEVRAVDYAHFSDLTPAVYDWEVEPLTGDEENDTTAPDTTIREAPAATSPVNTATFKFTGSDNATPGQRLTYECRLDGTAEEDWLQCTNPVTFNDLAVGSHTIHVRAVDRSGNKDQSPAVHAWKYMPPPPDVTAPDTKVATGPDFVTVQTSASFTFSSNEQGVTYACSLNGAAFASCAAPMLLENLGVRDHTLQVKATDRAGNTDATAAEHRWAVTAAPVPAEVSCGQTITQSTLVLNDLTDCVDVGLNIGADRITLDLDGHVIDGKDTAAGIRNNGFDFVTIRNGKVQEFEYGVQLNAGASYNIVEEIESDKHKEAGLHLVNADDGTTGNVIRTNKLTGSKYGVWMTSGTSGTVVRGNTLGGNYESGMRVENSNGNRIESNQINADGKPGVELVGATATIVKSNTLNRASIVVGEYPFSAHGNYIEGNALDGGNIEVVQSNKTQIINNIVHGANDSGVYLDNSNETLVKGNDLRNNKGGLGLKASSRNRLEGNNASESEGTAIHLEAGSLRNVLVLNIANISSGQGIYIGDPASPADGNLLDRNNVNGNGSDGISVTNFGHKLVGNIADDNDGWGIYAVAPNNGQSVIDGGGNRAKENKNFDQVTLSQCYNIRCDGVSITPTDETPPETAVFEGPPNSTLLLGATFRFTGTDSESQPTFECRIASIPAHAEFSACTSPKSYSGLVPGLHTFEVRAVDVAGNADPSPADYVWTVLAPEPGVDPETTIISGPDPVTVARTAQFVFSSNEPGATFECSLNGASWAACDSPKDYADFTTGTQQFRVRAVDIEGRKDLSPATVSWSVGFAPVPSEVGCGEILTRSTRVMNDLLDCEGDGLLIGADGITVDLDGHVIDGNGLGAGIVNTGYDNVTITNGTFQEYMYGVELRPGSQRNIVSGVTVQVNEEGGITLSDADNAQVRNNTVTGNGFGIVLYAGSRGAVIRNNTLEANGDDGIRLESAGANRIEGNDISTSAGAAVIVEGAGDNVIVNNNLTSNGGGVLLGLLELPSNGNTVEGNTISGSMGPGIYLAESDRNSIRDNLISGSQGEGIGLEFSDDNVIRGNELGGNGDGVALEESSRNQVDFNTVSGSGGAGIFLGAIALDNMILSNISTANGGEGIAVEDLGPVGQGNLIEGNMVSSNGGEGLMVAAAGHTLRNNSAYTNGGWGVYAEAGNTDGGGHRAAGNVEPGECYNIVCTIGDAPGAPQTTIETKPTNPSNSRMASFTFIGSDDTTPLINIMYECRLDSTDPLDWDECEYPQLYLNLQPGQHTFEVRAVDENEIADSTPAKYTWTYTAPPTGIAPDTTIDSFPPDGLPILEWIFLVSSNEPDTQFECQIDNRPWEQCGLEAPLQGGYYEAKFEEFEIGRHTFRARAIDIEGRYDPTPATYTWVLSGGPITTIASGPAPFYPSVEPGEPPTGGETASTTATFTFYSDNEPESTFYCGLDVLPGAPADPSDPNGGYRPCNTAASGGSGYVKTITYRGLAIGEHTFSVFGVSPDGLEEIAPVVFEWEVIPPLVNEAPVTTITSAPESGTSGTEFQFTATDDLTPPSLLVFECRLDGGLFEECISPYNLLENLTPDQFFPGEHRFEVRAVDDTEPEGIAGLPDVHLVLRFVARDRSAAARHVHDVRRRHGRGRQRRPDAGDLDVGDPPRRAPDHRVGPGVGVE